MVFTAKRVRKSKIGVVKGSYQCDRISLIPLTWFHWHTLYMTAPVKLHRLRLSENYIVGVWNRSEVEEPTNHNAQNKAFQLVYSSACDFGNLVFTESWAMKSQAEQLYILLQTPWNWFSVGSYHFIQYFWLWLWLWLHTWDSENQAKCVISTIAWAHDNKYLSQKAYLCLTD